MSAEWNPRFFAAPPTAGGAHGRDGGGGQGFAGGGGAPRVCLDTRVNVDTLIDMQRVYAWDEAKRQQNLSKHRLDFLDADLVLESPYRLEVDSERSGERRRQAFAYVFEVLTVLTVVYLPGDTLRIISFRPANRREREKYHEWLEIDREVE